MNEFVYPINNIKEFVFGDQSYRNIWFDRQYMQLLYAEQSTSSTISNTLYFDNQFSAQYRFSASSLYYGLAQLLGNLKENDWDKVAGQYRSGIWKTPSATASDTIKEVADRVQNIKISSHYYGDEIANGSFRLYYLPIITSQTGSLSSQQTQNVLRFIDVNHDYNGSSFATTSSTAVALNLSGTTTGFTVEFLYRPIQQDKSGYFFHRWTTDGNRAITKYSEAGTNTLASHSSYSANPYFGVGARFNNFAPTISSDVEKPYIDFYVYGGLSGQSDLYVNLPSGLIEQNTNTRFFLEQKDIDTLFDGSFHSVKFVWSINDYYKNGKIYVDGKELEGYVARGTGRTSAVNYSLTGTLSATPMYFMSKHDNSSLFTLQTSSKDTAYGETKQILVFDRPLTSTSISQTVSSSTHLFTSLGSSTAGLVMWFGFHDVSSPYIAPDKTVAFGLQTRGVSGTIVNDSSNSEPEGKIARIFSLLHDNRLNYVASKWDDSLSASVQKPVGKLYNNEYDVSSSAYIGTIFYDRGNVLVLNDHYNSSYGLSTQRFTTSRNIFSTVSSSTSWQVYYTSFASRRYVDRRIMTVTADYSHFAKSTNGTANFKGNDDKAYTKSNKKYITGIVWYGKNGLPLAITKFSEPVLKPENHTIVFDTKLDL